MAEAPAVHGSLSLGERCELSLAGFILFDLWALLAAKREAANSCYKGSHFMAPQTRRNLQNVALATVVITATKEASWDPFSKDQNLSEIHMERNFGRLRSMSESGNLTARTYWAHGAALSRQQLYATEKEKEKTTNKAEPVNVPCLTDDE